MTFEELFQLFIDHKEVDKTKTKYIKWYKNIIENAKTQNRRKTRGCSESGYFERHHVLPASEFEEFKNLSCNLVLLTLREHFLCHRLLDKFTIGHLNFRMKKAITMFRHSRNKYRVLNSKQYEIVRKTHAESMKGENSPFFNKVTVFQNGSTSLIDKIEYHNNKENFDQISKNMVTIKLNNGENIKIHKDDLPSYEDFSFCGFNKNFVRAIDKETGEYITVNKEIFDKDDLLVGVTFGMSICFDKTLNKHIAISKNDIAEDPNRYCPVNKDKVMAKNKSTNEIMMIEKSKFDADDDFVGISKGMIWIKNHELKRERTIYETDLPNYQKEGWVLGNFCSERISGLVWMNRKDIKKNARVKPEDTVKYLDDGWSFGRLPFKKIEERQNAKNTPFTS